MTLVYRSTVGRRLTVSEGDGNISELSSAAGITFAQSGTAPTARTVEDVERAIVRSGDYALTANYESRLAALTETIGMAKIDVGPRTGWSAEVTAGYVDTAVNWFGSINQGLVGATQTNYFMFTASDNSNAASDVAALYGAMVDAHATGSKNSSVGFEGDILHTGAGTTTGESGVVGFARIDAGVVGDQLGVQGQAKVTGGTVTRSAGVYGISIVSGGTVDNSYSGLFVGPDHSGGTVTNNYGIYVGDVGTSGTSSNVPLYIAHALGAFSVDRSGWATNAGQPAFLAYNSATDTDVTGDGTFYTIVCNTEVFDQGTDYDNTTGIFTAPVAGRYQLSGAIALQQLAAGHTQVDLLLVTSNRTYQLTNIVAARAETNMVPNISVLADMDANDTAYLQIYVAGGAKAVDVVGAASAATFFSGILLA